MFAWWLLCLAGCFRPLFSRLGLEIGLESTERVLPSVGGMRRMTTSRCTMLYEVVDGNRLAVTATVLSVAV